MITKPTGRRQAQRQALAAIGDELRELVKTHTIKEAMELFPGRSRATLYRAMRLSADRGARDPLLL